MTRGCSPDNSVIGYERLLSTPDSVSELEFSRGENDLSLSM